MRFFRIGILYAGLVGGTLGVAFTTWVAAIASLERQSAELERASRPDAPAPTIDVQRLSRLLKLDHPAPLPRPGPLPWRLRGTLSGALACVEPETGGHALSVRLGEQLGDATVEEIGHGYLMLSQAGVLQRLTVGGAAPATRTLPDETLEVPRAQLEAVKADWPKLASQVGIVPAFEQGVAIGFRVAWLAPDALALKVGLRAGDVVTAVNGHPLTDSKSIPLLFAELQNSQRFVADVRRGREALRLEVRSF